jgi:hypothetical protein
MLAEKATQINVALATDHDGHWPYSFVTDHGVTDHGDPRHRSLRELSH